MSSKITWDLSEGFTPYTQAVEEMESHVANIIDGSADERVWLVEHSPCYTAGRSAVMSDHIGGNDFPVYETNRGGQLTYHGTGQRVAYVMLDIKRLYNNAPDIRKFVFDLEEWIIQTLAAFDVKGERREGRIGIWVVDEATGRENKIAALGIHVRKWISYHGIAINVNPDLSHFGGIVPCGIREHGVTSLHDLGKEVSMAELDAALKKSFKKVFGD